MRSFRRSTLVLAAQVALVPALGAQIPGMPLFTNPRYSTGLRVHADLGQPTQNGTSVSGSTVVQGGVTFALGPIGIGANVGMLNSDLKKVSSGCSTCTSQTAATASALAQLRLAGGGTDNLSLSIFGGASMQLKAYDFATSGMTQAQKDSLAAAGVYGDSTKQINIPLGAALGLRLPIMGINVWGAPRWTLVKFLQCPTSGSGSANCTSPKTQMRWAVGADLPILGLLSVRAAYDTGKDFTGATTTVWGIGASIGFGGMR